MEVTKYCPKCHTRKLGSEFYKSKTTSDGLAGYCKECSKKISRAYILAHPEKAKNYRKNAIGKYTEKRKEWAKEYRQRPEVKAKAKARYETAEYKQKAHERYIRNKEKRKAYSRDYYANHKEQAKEYGKKYRANNADEIRKTHAKYYREIVRFSEEEKVKRAKYMKTYKKERLEKDPLFKFKERARKNIANSFLRRGYTKKSKSQKIIGCDWLTFVRHLLKTWENRYGSMYAGEDYHIDHIIPLAQANTEEEVIRLCHYTNLQLLKPEDNLSKSSKIQ